MALTKDFQDVSSVEKGRPDLTNSGQVLLSVTISYMAEEEQRALCKVDLALLPDLTFHYLSSFLNPSKFQHRHC
ncbi:hypothetical protein NBRC10512v2_001992 [Rhodotorula toruloides]|uniref:RHTO0S03e12134g1_1 n=2 Tax=Rhodotorula toruloides TaxID=5286 RepID=A0A061AM60_RHOTO|nr:uncharacterized protein RHTO_00570 [Rhodotorula toruloides NP11]EMS26142.1 hypothetical protein RHTO_00570 [Rhodotorula toruloides NP11]CDR38683.1 RHTO0S03e12134g1_1 [Rhodotorula toruloides]